MYYFTSHFVYFEPYTVTKLKHEIKIILNIKYRKQ